jgi:hypothetical protein
MDLFSRAADCFVDWISRKGPDVLEFYPRAALFLSLTMALYVLGSKVKGGSILLLGAALVSAFLIVGLLPQGMFAGRDARLIAFIVACCIFLVGGLPIWLARTVACGRWGQAAITLMLYLLLLVLFALNFVL